MGKLLKERAGVEILGEINGAKIVSYADQAELAAEIIDANPLDTGNRKVNPDGTIARSKVDFVSVNVENEFINRFRQVSDKAIQVVTDYRAIKEIATNNVYRKSLPAYEIIRKNGKLVVDKIVMISDQTLVADFTNILNYKGMMEVREAISNYNGKLVPESDLVI